MKRVLVVGGLGFIGHHVAALERDKGNHVVIVDSLFGFKDTAYDKELERERREHVKGCELYIQSFSTWVDEHYVNRDDYYATWDKVYYLGGVSSQRDAVMGYHDLIRSAISTVQAITILKPYVTETITFASTSMVYGSYEGAIREVERCEPISDYGRSRLVSELLLNTLRDLPGGAITVARFCAVYGLRDNNRRVLGSMMHAAVDTGELNVNTLSGVLDFTYVGDLVDALYDFTEYRGKLVKTSTDNLRLVFNFSTGRNQGSLIDIANSISDWISDDRMEVVLYEDSSYPTRDILDTARLGIALARIGNDKNYFSTNIFDKLHGVLDDILMRSERARELHATH